MTERQEKIVRVAKHRQSDITIVLEDIHDPHNAQAVVRSADAFGIQHIHFIFSREPSFNPKKVGKASSSSANKWVTFHSYSSAEECLKKLNSESYHLVGTALDESAHPLFSYSFPSAPVALFFGNEHRGLSETILQSMHTNIYIPMRGMVQSLNISVAASICMYEFTRQRIGHDGITPYSQNAQQLLVEQFTRRK